MAQIIVRSFLILSLIYYFGAKSNSIFSGDTAVIINGSLIIKKFGDNSTSNILVDETKFLANHHPNTKIYFSEFMENNKNTLHVFNAIISIAQNNGDEKLFASVNIMKNAQKWYETSYFDFIHNEKVISIEIFTENTLALYYADKNKQAIGSIFQKFVENIDTVLYPWTQNYRAPVYLLLMLFRTIYHYEQIVYIMVYTAYKLQYYATEGNKKYLIELEWVENEYSKNEKFYNEKLQEALSNYYKNKLSS